MTSLPLPVAVPGDLTLLDEDWAVPCERAQRAKMSPDEGRTWLDTGQHCGARNPAEWILHSACGCSPTAILYCTGCRDLVLSYHHIGCPTCGEDWVPGRLAFRLIEPLNRRTT